MIIAVYAIAKNEERHVERFLHAASEADYVCVLDTGSTDNTVQLLQDGGAIVSQTIIDPWRFDVARNESLDLIPADTDVCVCLDLDEVLQPGWREILEAAWTDDTDIGRYTCVSSRNADGSPGTSFLRDKIHQPGKFWWKYPVHEVLVPKDYWTEIIPVSIPGMIADHLPDHSKDRSGYLKLLELATAELPHDARCAHYLGREYMYAGRWEDAIRELERHLELPSAVWYAERSASLRYIADCHRALGNNDVAMRKALHALAILPKLRENLYACEKAAYYLEDWRGVVYYGELAHEADTRTDSGINEAEAWGAGVYDLLSMGYWHTGKTLAALGAAVRAQDMCGNNDRERIRKNIEFFHGEITKETANDNSGSD